MNLAHKFVDSIPEELEDGVLYVSVPFGTVVHKCACGCGEEVVTPLGPAEWRLTYDGRRFRWRRPSVTGVSRAGRTIGSNTAASGGHPAFPETKWHSCDRKRGRGGKVST